MSEENKQDLKETQTQTDETLNLTGKELEEYKTYLKFKNEIEKQNKSQKDAEVKSQNVRQSKSQSQDNKSSEKSTTKSFQKEMGITDRNDPDYTFDEGSLKKIRYKQYFMEPVDIKTFEKYRNELIKVIVMQIICSCVFYRSTIGYNSSIWIIFKIMVGFYVAKNVIQAARDLIIIEPISTLKPKIYNYNAVIRDAKWEKLSNKDENFLIYYDIAKDTIKNKLRLIRRSPNFKRYKYTEIYHILNSNIYIVYGIYDSIGFKNTSSLGYMLVIENGECFMNVVCGEVMRKKLKILDDI